jgi:pimeloyl-ACP methyl ester carboxylesterase
MEIDTLEAVRSGDATQWIRVRGADAANPVLLLIQQGPGLPMINEARRFGHLLGLEQAFTVVYWDQRGCGRSLRRRQDRAGISRERLVADTVSLLDLLHERFGAKTYVAGFSFGATLGAYAAAQRLDLIAALPRIDVPVVLVQGRHDQVAPGAAAERYAGLLQAPSKRLVWFENSAHTPHLEEPGKFRDLLLAVRDRQLTTTSPHQPLTLPHQTLTLRSQP